MDIKDEVINNKLTYNELLELYIKLLQLILSVYIGNSKSILSFSLYVPLFAQCRAIFECTYCTIFSCHK